MARRLNEQEMDDMRAAYHACLDGEIPDWRHGFFDLAMLVLQRVPDDDIVHLESLVNNWQQVNFSVIFKELEFVINNNQRWFRDLDNEENTSSDDDDVNNDYEDEEDNN